MILLCNYSDETYVFSVSEDDTLMVVLGRIFGKWSCLKPPCVKLFYKLAGCGRSFLCSEEDLNTLHVIAKSFTGPGVPLYVIEESISGCSTSNPCLDDVVDFEPTADENIMSASSLREKSRMNLGWDKISFVAGTVFYGGAPEFRLALQKMSLQTGFQYVLTKNDSSRVTASCPFNDENKCKWMVHAIRVRLNGNFYVKSSCPVHVCGTAGRSFEGSRMSSDLLAEVIESIVRARPNVSPALVKHDLFSQFGMKVTYFKARIGVWKAKGAVFGDVRESFRRLPLYVQSVLAENPGSHVVWDMDAESGRFRRLFVAFDACIRGFNSCRPLLFLDGAHLKGQFKGHLLAATGKDGNQGIYPLCFAVVASEDSDNWEWFMNNLKLILDPLRQITFITDRNPGLITSIRSVFPNAHHAFCLYHLKLNLREQCSQVTRSKIFRNRMVELLVQCAYASTELDFDSKMNVMVREGRGAVTKFFQHLKPESWSNAYFKGSRYGYVSSSAAESFNAWVVKERHLPVVELVDAIRIKIMKRLSDKRVVGASWTRPICPEIDSRLSVLMDASRNWNVVSSTAYVYEVYSSPTASVNLKESTCSCGEWQRFRYPCSHGVAAILAARFPLHDYIDSCYKTSSFVESYGYAIYPVPNTYQTVDISTLYNVLPPFSRRQPGRPRNKRIPSRGESTRVYKCGRCGASTHHNRTTCMAATQLG